MKGRVIDDAQTSEEDSEVGGGLACPNCEQDMRKTLHSTTVIALTGVDEVEVDTEPFATVFVCDACGYREEVERE